MQNIFLCVRILVAIVNIPECTTKTSTDVFIHREGEWRNCEKINPQNVELKKTHKKKPQKWLCRHLFEIKNTFVESSDCNLLFILKILDIAVVLL